MNTTVLFSESELSRNYHEEGFCVLESVIPMEHLELLRRVCNTAVGEIQAEMDALKTDVLGINHRGQRYFIGQSYRQHPELGAFLFGDLMAAIARATLGPDVFLHNDQFVVKEEMGSRFSWHQDGAYVQARIGDHPECITCWCALDDVTEENGTIYLLPVSRFGKRELVPHEKDPVSNDRVGYWGDDPGDPVIAPAGSMVVFSSVVFHRSGPNPTQARRRAYLAQYASEPIVNNTGSFPQYFAKPFLKEGIVVKT
jgi:ectoine hydroxylase-related dioxygenase (phytanoyl-CoA dioxygenase family)